MALHAVFEVCLQFCSFRNIDVLHQGLYAVESQVYVHPNVEFLYPADAEAERSAAAAAAAAAATAAATGAAAGVGAAAASAQRQASSSSQSAAITAATTAAATATAAAAATAAAETKRKKTHSCCISVNCRSKRSSLSTSRLSRLQQTLNPKP